MNERQSQELEQLTKLEAEGSLEEVQKERFEELKSLKVLAEKTAEYEKKSKDFESARAQKEHFREKAEKAEAERKALEEQIAASKGNAGKPPLAVEDYIDISASLQGLDQREQAYLAEQHRLTGKPLAEIRKGEDFSLWQSAYEAKREKEKANLVPSNKQPDANAPVTLEEALNAASSQAEKEKILAEAGLYQERGRRADRVVIGNSTYKTQ